MNELLIVIIEVEKVLGESNETHYEPLKDERKELTRRDFMLLMKCWSIVLKGLMVRNWFI